MPSALNTEGSIDLLSRLLFQGYSQGFETPAGDLRPVYPDIALLAGLPQTAREELIAVASKHHVLVRALRVVRTAAEELRAVTPAQALKHPTWKMGSKITIDSSTLMNKGLEVIEAHWLFDLPADRIDVVIHPQSIVHSMVEYVDGSVLAQLGIPDMAIPISYILAHPERLTLDHLPSLDLVRAGRLEFLAPDLERFPCLALAYRALRAKGTAPAVLNAANEVLVEAFLQGRIAYLDIAHIAEAVLDRHETIAGATLEQLLAADAWARDAATGYARGEARAASA